MGRESNIKMLRSQLRQIVKEMWPSIQSTELYKELQKQNKDTLELVMKLTKESLERIEEKQKTVQSMVMREIANANAPKVEEPAKE